MTPHAKCHVNLPKEASWQIGEIYAKNFIAIYLFFLPCMHLQVRPLNGFLHAMAQTMRYQARVCLLGVRKLKLNI